MNCPTCNALNTEGAKFCSNCGTQLPIACPNCGAQVSSGARFCHNCGHALAAAAGSKDPPPVSPPTLQAPQPAQRPDARIEQYIPKELLGKLQAARTNRNMSGERRIVTVLFCDVQGSTAIAEQLDPEEWAEIMNGAFKHLIAPIYKYEGTLARLMGDAILAFFGAPIAHEDDPQRAVLAGLEIVEGIKPYREQVRREHGFSFDVRVGINTGLVVVGEIGSDLRVEYTAMGDAVNVAARMEQSAGPGSVHISGNTYRTIHNLFHFEPLGSLEVKGKAEPVPAYRVIAALEGAVPTRGIEGLQSPMVGRDAALQTLKGCLNDLRSGCGRIISVMGEAGLGKSRLLAELRRSESGGSEAQDRAHPVAWHEGRSLSYETSTPYAPINDLLRSLFALGTDVDPYSKIRAGVEEALPGRGDDLAPFLASPLGIKLEGDPLHRVMYLEPPALRVRVSEALALYVEAVAARSPVAFVFEDLHWVDNTSLETIQALLPVTERAPLLLVALMRPHTTEPSWRLHEAAARDYPHLYTQIALQPLDEESARMLVANLLEIEDLPEKVRALILQKAEGNPFYVEEVIRSLLDNGLVVREEDHWRATRDIENIAVPDTLAGVITARLDRLDEEAKSVAQTAAVVGREFELNVLSEVYEAPDVLEGAVTTLQRRELVRERSRVPQRVYTFKHVLTQETAYASVLLSRRRELHKRVAECLERLDPGRVNSIARHFMEARERGRALPYLVEAGEAAARSFARDEAIWAFREALGVIEALQPSPTDHHVDLARRAFEGLGKTLQYAMDVPGAAENYSKMLRYAEAHGDDAMRVSAFNKLAYVNAFMMGEFMEAQQYLDSAENLAREVDDSAGLVENYTMRCGMCTAAADFTNAERYLSEAVEAGRKMEQKRIMAYGLAHKANTQAFMAHYDEAFSTAQETLKVAEEAQDLERRAEVLAQAVSFCHVAWGNLDAAWEAAEEAYELSRKLGLTIPAVVSTYMMATVAQLRGEYEKALHWHEKSIDAARVIQGVFPFMVAMPLGGIGGVCIEIGEGLAERAMVYHRELLELLPTPFGAPSGGVGWTDLGFCALALGAVEQAGEYFRLAIAQPSMHMYIQKPRIMAGSALVALAQGNLDEAARLLDEANAYADEHRMRCFYPLLYEALGDTCMAQGDGEGALGWYTRAEEEASNMGMRPALWQARLGAARALDALDKRDEAAQERAGANATISEITSFFEDPALRTLYAEAAVKRAGAPTAAGK
jgi:class 3 adenylate cyclase/tetratricopeptide (TPR) repeat protein